MDFTARSFLESNRIVTIPSRWLVLRQTFWSSSQRRRWSVSYLVNCYSLNHRELHLPRNSRAAVSKWNGTRLGEQESSELVRSSSRNHQLVVPQDQRSHDNRFSREIGFEFRTLGEFADQPRGQSWEAFFWYRPTSPPPIADLPRWDKP